MHNYEVNMDSAWNNKQEPTLRFPKLLECRLKIDMHTMLHTPGVRIVVVISDHFKSLQWPNRRPNIASYKPYIATL